MAATVDMAGDMTSIAKRQGQTQDAEDVILYDFLSYSFSSVWSFFPQCGIL